MSYLYRRIKDYEDEALTLEHLLYQGDGETEEAQQPKYRMVIFDLDGVIYDKPWHETINDRVAVSTWDVLFQELGIYNIHEKLKQNFVDGVFDSYMSWTDAACNVLKSVGLDRKTFQKVIDQRPISIGAKELLQKLRKHNVLTAVISGSFDSLAQRADKEIGPIDEVLAHCKLFFGSNGFLQSWEIKPTDYEGKAVFVETIAKQHGLSLKDIAYVGDDVNDVDVFKKVGLAIAFNSTKLQVQQAAEIVIDGRDLTAVLPHLYVVREKPLTNQTTIQ